MNGGVRDDKEIGWSALLRSDAAPALVVLVGGVLLHSMNVLLLATVLPTIVGELGGAAMMSWPTTGFLASSIVASTGAGLLTTAIGPRRTYCLGVLVFGVGALLCAAAPTMAEIVAGRFVQGFGGGLLTAVAYVTVRSSLPEAVWPRGLALLSGAWSVSFVIGPLAGGLFARDGEWRTVFVGVAVLAGLLAVAAARSLPRAARDHAAARPGGRTLPIDRVALIGLAIAALSSAAIVAAPWLKAGLIALTVAALVVVLWLDRAAAVRLLPSDAFSLGSTSGIALWSVLLVSIAYSPLQIFVPIFLQRLHGFAPLAAGYGVASASFAWTLTSITVAGVSTVWSGRFLIAGPFVMTTGLIAVSLLGPAGPVAGLLPALMTVGIGIGMCWTFTAQRVMAGARPSEATIAASATVTVQMVGFALGGAAAGLVANAAGFASQAEMGGLAQAAFWVPACFTVAGLAAGLMGVRLARVAQRRAVTPATARSPS